MKRTAVVILTLCIFTFAAFATVDDGLRFAALAKYYLKDRYTVPPETQYLDHPFLTSVLKPNQTVVLPNYPGNGGGTLDFRTNAYGFRSPEFSVRKAPGVYRIVVLGGSAALTGSDEAHTFPGRLRIALNRGAGGPRYEVINTGTPGFTSTQELFLTAAQVAAWTPDLVIVYDGRNDMFYGSMPSYRPNWVPRNDEVIAFLRKPAAAAVPAERYPFLYTLYRSRVARPAAAVEPSAAYATPEGKRFAYTPHRDAVDVYRGNLRSLVAITRERGARVVLVYQPTLLHKAVRTSQEEAVVSALAPRYTAAMGLMLPLGAQAMREAANVEHVPMLDLTAIFDDVPGTMFIDDVHPTDAGNEIVARRIYTLIHSVVTAPGNGPLPGK